jgi:exodeoxyribonuclease III
MRLISWNVNGIRAIAGKGFKEWMIKTSPDVLCLQETKASPGQLDESLVSPRGYFSYWNGPARKGYAGVCVYAREKPVSVEKDFPPDDLDTEGRTLIARFKDFVLINVYFPNGGQGPERLKYKLDFYDRFLEYVDGLKTRNIVICGDVNTAHKEIDLARPKQNEIFTGFLPVEREWIDKLVEHGYVDTFRHFNNEPGQYSWWDYKTRSRERNVGWRIDYFFVTKELLPRLKNAFIMSDIMGSDHCPVGIELDD